MPPDEIKATLVPDPSAPNEPPAAGTDVTEKDRDRRNLSFSARADLTHEKAFWRLGRQVVKQQRTMLGLERLYVLWLGIRNAKEIRLPAVEVGAYRGGSAYFIASAFSTLTGEERPVYVLDTFSGHPADKLTSYDSVHQAGMFSDVDLAEVREYLAPFSKLRLIEGEFSKTAAALHDVGVCFAHIDVDLYEPTLEALRYLGERLAPRGVMVVDDYGGGKTPGVTEAVHEFLRHHGAGYQAWNFLTQQAVLVKR